MGTKMMKRNSLIAWLATAVLALTGCTMQPTVPTSGAPAEALGQEAALSLKFDFGRQVQMLAEDVTGATVSIMVNGRPPIVNSFERTQWATESLDFSGLKGGDALVRVEAYQGTERVGVGEQGVPLLVGRRTFASINIALDSRGKTADRPMTPLGPMPDPTARLFIQRVVFHTAGPLEGKQELVLVNRTGHPINDFYAYGLEYRSSMVATRSPFLLPNNSGVGFLAAGATMSVCLDMFGYPAEIPGMKAFFAPGTVALEEGALAVVKAQNDRPAAVVDFVQWGQPQTEFEPQAVQAGLWIPGGYMMLPDPAGYEGAALTVLQPGGRGFANWEEILLAPLPTK